VEQSDKFMLFVSYKASSITILP